MRLHEFLTGARERPYRELVQHHIRRQNLQQLAAATLRETSLLPPEFKPRVEGFVDFLNVELLRSQEFWRTATCLDAVNAVLRLANEHFCLAFPVPLDLQTMSGIQQELTFGLFQIATLSFAYTAFDQPKAREFMGIRKGLFAR